MDTEQGGMNGESSMESCVLSWLSCVWLIATLWAIPPGSSVHGDPPGKNTAVGRHALLQGIFLT